MAVHAHPDDEATGTGGILARYAGQGIRTVLVACTNGEMGDAPAGSSRASRATTRRPWWRCCAEGARGGLPDPRGRRPRAARLPGLRDGGLAVQRRAAALSGASPVRPRRHPLAGLYERYRPDVVVTYDAQRLLRPSRPHPGPPHHPRGPRPRPGPPPGSTTRRYAGLASPPTATAWPMPVSILPTSTRTSSARPTRTSPRPSTAASEPRPSGTHWRRIGASRTTCSS